MSNTKKFQIGEKMDRSRDLSEKRSKAITKKFIEIVKTTEFELADPTAREYIMDLIGKKRMTKGVWLSLTIDMVMMLQFAMINKDDNKEDMFSAMSSK